MPAFRLVGTMVGMRRWLPLQGTTGGAPGACTQFLVHRPNGSVEKIATRAAGVEIMPGEVFEFRCASGGGFGDSLDRDPQAVIADVQLGRITATEALEVYGVVAAVDGRVDAAAISEHSGAPLAIAPPHWTDGCPVLEERLSGEGPGVVVRSYLDPLTGRALYVEAVPAGEPRSFELSPNRWTNYGVINQRAARKGD